MNTIKKDWWILILAGLSWVATLIIRKELPSMVPVQWDLYGEVQRWGSPRTYGILALLPPGIWAGMTFLPHIDPKKENYALFSQTYRIMRGSIVLMTMGFTWIAIGAAFHPEFPLPILVKGLLGILFIILGNITTRIQPNWSTGIKTPWTLSNPVIWKKTHRLGGYILVASGMMFLLAMAIPHQLLGFWLSMGSLILGLLITNVYSILLWRNLHKGESKKGWQEEESSL
ncbi:MAG: SdpI family protein [Spirochaetales bacterium]|nr:SdpI family protein [Spirochaetales bacterium]